MHLEKLLLDNQRSVVRITPYVQTNPVLIKICDKHIIVAHFLHILILGH